MNAKIKAEWLAALRSGRYPQVKDCLHNALGYCCLGVLCEVTNGRAVWEPSPKKRGMYMIEGFDVAPPYWISAGAGLPDSTIQTLADWNDSGMTFAEIADFIEANL